MMKPSWIVSQTKSQKYVKHLCVQTDKETGFLSSNHFCGFNFTGLLSEPT